MNPQLRYYPSEINYKIDPRYKRKITSRSITIIKFHLNRKGGAIADIRSEKKILISMRFWFEASFASLLFSQRRAENNKSNVG